MEFQIKISFVEIYCERIRDLFDPKNDNLTGAFRCQPVFACMLSVGFCIIA